jgi:hypothetical protein
MDHYLPNPIHGAIHRFFYPDSEITISNDRAVLLTEFINRQLEDPVIWPESNASRYTS